jgi:plastocyanin
LLAAVLVAVAAPGVGAASPKQATVELGDDYFDPGRVTIRQGGKVVWQWVGSNPHNVALKAPGASKVVKRSRLKESGRFTHRFDLRGRWTAVCEIHPRKMTMRVVVKRR